MHPTRPLRILVLAAQADRIRLAVGDLGEVAIGTVELGDDVCADVVVTDLPPQRMSRELAGTVVGRRQSQPPGSGIVGIGEAAWADVALAADFTDRELRLACLTAARIAALRRERDELARVHQEAAQLAETDPLTGLPNRRAWETRLPAKVAQAARGDLLWLAIADLDCFKQINDTAGMHEGDRVLVATAQALAGAMRRSDLVARLGGDEFGIVLAGIPADRVENVLERLRTSVSTAGHVTASVGYVALQANVAVSELMAAAEKAMRRAKQAGGDRIEAA